MDHAAEHSQVDPTLARAGIVRVTPIIGLEVHVQLETRRKMFARCAATPQDHEGGRGRDAGKDENSLEGSLGSTSSAWGLAANTYIDETVLALPGSLPVMNRGAVEKAAVLGLLLRCALAPVSRWDRKAYFYPDLPKAYQISQYDLPLCFDGAFDIPSLDEAGVPDPRRAPTRIGIVRAHLEEDAGKLLHEAPGGRMIDHSIVDYNRAGTPLLEIVTQPDFRSAGEVVVFARLLRAACRDAGASRAVLERGHMRFEPNINCEIQFADGTIVRTPIVEVKNLNSFRALKAAVEFEIAEQPRRYLADRRVMGKGAKSTRGFDDSRGVTFVQRTKEDADEYRYFPDPDLPAVELGAHRVEELAKMVPEAPFDRLVRLSRELDLDPKDALAVVEEPGTARLIDRAADLAVAMGVDRGKAGRASANIVLQNMQRRANELGVGPADLGVPPGVVAAIVALRADGRIGNQAVDALLAVDTLAEAEHGTDHGGDHADPRAVLARVEAAARERGLLIVRDEGAVARWIAEALAAQPEAAASVRAGKQQALGRLVGEVMKRSGGQADAARVREALLKALE
jgi:aspartyl-tRNA(Asn)/glutamyl-tRNA(Gln) amidotransferase subunit B